MTMRRGDSEVNVISSSVCSIRSVRSVLNAPSGTTTRPSNARQTISAMNVHCAGVLLPASACVTPKNATASPATQAGDEGGDELAAADHLSHFLHDDRADVVARASSRRGHRVASSHCTARPSVISMKQILEIRALRR